MAMEYDDQLSAPCLDAINAFGEIERACIKATLLANPTLHTLIPLFEMLYERGSGKLCFYEENGNFIDLYCSPNEVRQGCVMGPFLSCLAMYPVYSRLHAMLGPEGTFYAYFDDVYIISDVAGMARALVAALVVYKIVRL